MQHRKCQHFTLTCDQFLKDGKCDGGAGCQFRHPTVCKYWKNDEQGCKRDEACKYLHQNNQSIKATKSKESKIDAINTECVDMHIEVMDSMDENVFENTDEVLNIGELETLIASKDKTIKELRFLNKVFILRYGKSYIKLPQYLPPFYQA